MPKKLVGMDLGTQGMGRRDTLLPADDITIPGITSGRSEHFMSSSAVRWRRKFADVPTRFGRGLVRRDAIATHCISGLVPCARCLRGALPPKDDRNLFHRAV